MKKIIRLSATLAGAFSLITGFTACSKDDDNNNNNNGGIECCSYTYTENGNTYTYKACSDGTYIFIDNGVTYTYTDSYIADNWEYYKSYIKKIGGTCN